MPKLELPEVSAGSDDVSQPAAPARGRTAQEQNGTTGTHLGFFACGGICLAVAVLILSLIAPDAYRGQASLTWPTTVGEVIRAVSYQRGKAPDTAVFPDIRYRYHLLGCQYESHNVSFGANLGNGLDVKSTLKRYRVGQPVVVHYDPNASTFACLEPGLSGSNLDGWALIEASLVFAGLLCIWIGRRIISR